jgi:hypothetical protein
MAGTEGRMSTARDRSAVWMMVILAVVAALALIIGGVAWYKPGAPSVSSRTLLAPSKEATTSANGLTPAQQLFARRMYLEQVQSGTNIDRLAEGKLVSFDVTSRKVAEDTATVGITAHFVDGTSAPGSIGLVRDKGSWYFFSMEGERGSGVSGYAAGVDPKGSDQVDSFADVPDSAIDWNLAAEMVRQQTSQQEYLKALVEGPTARYVLGKPSSGAGTVNIDATVYSKGHKVKPAKIRLVLVPSTFDGRPYTFVAGMRPLGN